MSSRREDILKEMGLTPRWRLRPRERVEPAAPAAEGPADAASIETPTRVSASGAHDGRSDGYRHAPAVTQEPSLVADHASPLTPSPLPCTDERRAAIMRMDWPQLKAAVAGCAACPLHEKRTNTVFGVGDERAEWMFVGEGPGADEDAQGEPFVGQAGKLLDNMLAAIDLKRERNVYIANVVKCRPPGNRNPQPGEAASCEPFLQRQIELVAPKLIVALGRVAALNLLSREASIASLRGRVLDFRGTPLIVTYHPAYLLRNLADKARAWEDLCFAVRTVQALKRQAGTTPTAGGATEIHDLF
jgi:uracil-DNA glycosylase